MSTGTSNCDVQDSSAYFPLDMLEDLVIIEIMKRMSIYDRMSFSQTCKSYYRLFNSSPSLHKDKIIKMKQEKYDAICNQFTSTVNKDITHVILPNITIELNSGKLQLRLREDFWAKYGPNVLKMKFITTNIEDGYRSITDFMVEVLSFCINMKELKLSTSEENLVNVLSTIKYDNLIKLDAWYPLTDYALNHFLVNSPKLHSIKTPCFISGVYEEISLPKHIPKDIPLVNLNREMLTPHNLLLVLSIRKDQIKVLDTVYASINVFKEIFQIENSKLEKLPLLLLAFHYYYDEITRNSSESEKNRVKRVFKMIKTAFGESLLDLLVSSLKGGNDWSRFNNFTIARELYISHTDIEGTIMDIKCFKKFNSLNIHCAEEEDPLLLSGEVYFGLQDFTHLRSLCLLRADLNKFESFLNAASFTLIELILEDCIGKISKTCMLALGKNQKSLRSLQFYNCEFQRMRMSLDLLPAKLPSTLYNEAGSSDPPFEFDRPTNIPSLCLVSGTGNDNDEESDENVTVELSGLKFLQNLQHFKLSNYVRSGFNYFSFLKDLESNELTELKLSDIVLTDKFLKTLSVNCPAITNLSLFFCKFTPAGAMKYLCNLKRLRNIEILWCEGVSQAGFDLIASSCPLKKCEYNLPN